MNKARALQDSELIHVESQGGIGNQLFIYAFARELQFRSGFPVVLDTWRHRLPNSRSFQVRALIGEETPIVDTSGSAAKVLGSHWHQTRHWKHKVSTFLWPNGKTICESDFSFNSRYFSVAPGTRLVGHFQSWRYFTQTGETLRSELQSARGNLLGNAPRDSTGGCVAIHIRLGDYLHPRHATTHRTVGALYYQQAVRRVTRGGGERDFMIFSDQPELAQQLLKQYQPSIRARIHEPLGSDLLDLLAMSTYDEIVCANSSFSWWAAWISGLAGNSVYVPRNWINKSNFSLPDLVPADWQVIN